MICSSGIVSAQTTKKVLELPEFKGIYVNSNYTVYLKQTNKQEVTVEALTEIFAVSEFKVENGILMINVDRKPESPNKSIWQKIDDIKLNPTMKMALKMRIKAMPPTHIKSRISGVIWLSACMCLSAIR